MEQKKKVKAILQAQASLRIDNIYLKDEFLTSYIKKHNLDIPNNGRKLSLERGKKNGVK